MSKEIYRPSSSELKNIMESSVESLRKRIETSGGEYSETLSINEGGWLDIPNDLRDTTASIFAHFGSGSPEELMSLAKRVHDYAPDLEFYFEKDPEGKWIKFTVKELKY